MQQNASAFLSIDFFSQEAYQGDVQVPVRIAVLLGTLVFGVGYFIQALLAPKTSYRLALSWDGGKHSADVRPRPAHPRPYGCDAGWRMARTLAEAGC
jgi:hypothetical protein